MKDVDGRLATNCSLQKIGNYGDSVLTTLVTRKKIKKIIIEWAKCGECVGVHQLPMHPEYVYRLSGEWKGWNHFLGADEETEGFYENIQRDRLEGAAFSELMRRQKHS